MWEAGLVLLWVTKVLNTAVYKNKKKRTQHTEEKEWHYTFQSIGFNHSANSTLTTVDALLFPHDALSWRNVVLPLVDLMGLLPNL